MNKDRMEVMARRAGLRPELRGNARGLDFFVADGFSSKPERDFQKFGAEEGEYPFGAYGTLWFVCEGEDKLIAGGLCIFDAFHDVGHPPDEKKSMRLGTARERAEEFLKDREKVNA